MFHSRAVEISGISSDGQNYYLATEECKKIYTIKISGDTTFLLGTIDLTDERVWAKDVEIEGLTYWNDFLVLSDEKNAMLFGYNILTNHLSKIRIDAPDEVVSHIKTYTGHYGMEGVAINKALSLLYLLREKDGLGNSEIMTFTIHIENQEIVLKYIDQILIKNKNKKERFTDLCFSDSSLYLIKSYYKSREKSKYEICKIKLEKGLLIHGAKGYLKNNKLSSFKCLTKKVKELSKDNYSTNIEGLFISKDSKFFLVSDNAMSSGCRESKEKTALIQVDF